MKNSFIREKKHYSVVLCIIFFAIIHILINAISDDDVVFQNTLSRMSLFEYLKYDYENWASRLILDGIWIVLLELPMVVWKILDTLVMALLFYDLHEICFGKNKKSLSVALLMVLCCYPFAHMGSAGWLVTTTNYTWPLSVGLLAVVSLFWIVQKRTFYWYHYLIFFMGAIIGGANELVAVIILSSFVVAVIYFIVQKISFPKWYVWIQIGISIANIIFILTCPGNAIRMAETVRKYMPDFYKISFFEKIRLNYVATFQHFISKPNVILFLLCAVVILGIWNTCGNWRKRLVSLIPMTIDVLFTGYFFVLQHMGLKESDYSNPVIMSNQGLITCTKTMEVVEQAAILVGFTILVVTLLVSIYWILNDNIKFGEILVILGLGFATRMAMSISPTMFLSSTRIYAFLYMALIIVIAIVWQSVSHTMKKWQVCCLYGVCAIGIVINLITTLHMDQAMQGLR